MKVFVAGASGALGKPVVHLLLEKGHEVFGMTSSRPEAVAAMGAQPVKVDAFDKDGVRDAIGRAKPDAVVNILTRIPHNLAPLPGQLKLNDRLRVEGTRNLIAAASAIEVTKMVAESITFAFDGRSEDRSRPVTGVGSFSRSVQAAVAKEEQVTGFGGVVLRFGYFYGPGTSISEIWPKAAKKKMLAILGKGTGWWSFIHLDDAASAVLAALDRGKPGETYNICDDEPVLAADAISIVCKAAGAGKPLHLPAVGPSYVKQYFNRATGASNSKAKTELGWRPAHPLFADSYAATVQR